MNIWEWIVDYAHLVYLQAASWFVTVELSSLNPDQVVLLFIPGVYERWSALEFLARTCRAAGFQTASLPVLAHNREPVAVLAKRIADFIDTHALQKVILVGHSKGGTVGQYMLRHYNDSEAVKHIIGIAVPWSGTTFGDTFRFKALRELLPTSSLIAELQTNHASDQYITAIYAEADNHIWDQPLHHPAAHNLLLPVKGHTYILFSKELPAIILDVAKHYEQNG